MERMHGLTTLVRFLDFRYRSNRAVTFVAGVAGVLGFFAWGAGSSKPGLGSALALAGASFLSWAFVREVDPDEPAAALLTALVAPLLAAWLGGPQLVVLVGLIAITRVLLRPVGPPPTPIDLLGLVALSVVLGARPGGWPVGLVLAFAVARDRTLPGPPARFGRLAALLIAAATTGAAIVSGAGSWLMPTAIEWALAFAGLGAGLLLRPVQPMSPTDVGGLVLFGTRLASARRTAMAALLLVVFVGGGAGIVGAAGAFAGMVSVMVVQRRIVPVGTGPEPRPAAS